MRKISNIKGTKITLSLFFKMFKQVYLQLLTTFSNTLLKEDWVKSFKVRNEKLEHQLFSQNNKRENRIEKSSENILKLVVCVLCAGEMTIRYSSDYEYSTPFGYDTLQDSYCYWYQQKEISDYHHHHPAIFTIYEHDEGMLYCIQIYWDIYNLSQHCHVGWSCVMCVHSRSEMVS